MVYVKLDNQNDETDEEDNDEKNFDQLLEDKQVRGDQGLQGDMITISQYGGWNMRVNRTNNPSGLQGIITTKYTEKDVKLLEANRKIKSLERKIESLEVSRQHIKNELNSMVINNNMIRNEHARLNYAYEALRREYESLKNNPSNNKSSNQHDLDEFMEISKVILKIVHPDKNQKFLQSLSEEEVSNYNRFVAYLLQELRK